VQINMSIVGAIIRPVVSRDYVSLPNAILSDQRLSIETRGMVCFILSKSKNFEIRPYALRKALSIAGQRLGRTKLDRMIAEAVAVGYMARSHKQARKKGGKFGRYAYICGLPEDVAAELQRQGAPFLPNARNPHPDNPHAGESLAGFGASLSTKKKRTPTNNQTNHQQHQSGQPQASSPVGRPLATDESYSQMGLHAKANGMTFIWVGSKPFQAWRAFRGDNGMPLVDVAVLDGVERRGCWMPSMYPPRTHPGSQR
jgi:hypothetical protein